MKKYVVGSLAIIMAFSAVAFPKVNATKSGYFWYKRTGLNVYMADGQGANPGVTCPTGSNICAKGFVLSRNPNTITDATVGDTPDRSKN